jgi:hypothetical protein
MRPSVTKRRYTFTLGLHQLHDMPDTLGKMSA